MDVEEFEAWLRRRNRADIEWLVDAVVAATDTADGEVEHLRASREVARRLDRSGLRRRGREAEHRVRLCALAVCADTGVRGRDPGGATRVARAAGDAARAIVAGEDGPGSALLVRPFLGAPLRAIS